MVDNEGIYGNDFAVGVEDVESELAGNEARDGGDDGVSLLFAQDANHGDGCRGLMGGEGNAAGCKKEEKKESC